MNLTDAIGCALLQTVWMLANAVFIVPAMVDAGGDLMVIGVLLLILCHAYLISAAILRAVRSYKVRRK